MSRSGRRVCLFVAAGLVLAAGTAWFALWYKFQRLEIVEDLPFEQSEMQSLPAANVPPGWLFSLESVSGRYSGGGFLGLKGPLDIRADGTWTSDASEFLGHPRRSAGAARVVEGRLELEVYSSGGKATGKRCYCIPVFWQDRIYLLDRTRIVQFCDTINWGREVSEIDQMDFFIHRDAKANTAAATGSSSFGRPLLPPKFDAMILRESLKGTIQKVSPDGSAVVSFGARMGAFEGMTLRAKTGEVAPYSPWGGASLLMLSLSTDSCVVRRKFDGVPLTEGTEVFCPAEGSGLK